MSPHQRGGAHIVFGVDPVVSALESASFSNILIIMSPHQRGGAHIVFGADSVGVGVKSQRHLATY